VEDEEEGWYKWDTVDGGTTATIAAVLRGSTLVVAGVGDSSCLLLGQDSAGKAAHEQLLAEHSPTNLDEFVRMQALPSRPNLKFIYDCPDCEDFPIFTFAADGTACLDAEGLQQADEQGVMVKNARNDRFTLLLIPGEEVEIDAAASKARKASLQEQAITMTRSLGDFYAHHHGVTCEPELRSISLSTVTAASAAVLLASDGVWDIWEYEEVATELLSRRGVPLAERAAAFCEKTRATGNEWFGEAADNLTGVLFQLTP